jgi:DNA processing protein
MDFADLVAEDLSKAGVTVVSGLAFGIDGRAQRSALRGSGRTIAVMAGGVDVPYPAHHTELYSKVAASGLIISEFGPGTKPHTAYFPRRNRIVSGLSLGVLVVEALEEKSGSLITARLAAEQGRNVYVPSPDALHGLYAEGTKHLLMDGAFPIYRADDLLADILPHLKQALSRPVKTVVKEVPKPAPVVPSAPMEQEKAPSVPSAPVSPRPSVSGDESTLLDLLHASPLCPDDILLAAQAKDENWTAPRMLSTLMMLEVKGLVRRLADSRYEVRS